MRTVFGAGSLARLGELARRERTSRALLVTDPGVEAAGHADRATAVLRDAGLRVAVFDGARENPTDRHVRAGVDAAREADADCLVGLGGGSAMDCAKGINLLLTCGGEMSSFRGDPPPEQLALRPPLLPMILVPTTAGTGSEAQSFALISDSNTHEKMPCGDRRPPDAGGLRPRWAILDPDLTRTQPASVASAVSIDAIAHAVETAGSKAATDESRELSCEAWRLLDGACPRTMSDAADDDARRDMLLGAHLAGAAIERSMLGAAHACSNPLTARFGVVHGRAVGLMLPHVIRFNAAGRENPYQRLLSDPEMLARRVETLLELGGIPRRLRHYGVAEQDLIALADHAAAQWTARFNPRPLSAEDALALYRAAL
ncbi:MAG: NAD-dependent methanol dehydrogenase [Phycisphaerae bacterium]|nr:NAD-dependent methanol dehydrogenase [Phycisphaerae bacterium]